MSKKITRSAKPLPTNLQMDAKGNPTRRMMSLTIADKEARTIQLAFSSDAHLERWPGFIEILSHEPGACDLSRLNSGGNLLFNHKADCYIGVVERAWIDSDGKGRALVRFSKSEENCRFWGDVEDGILRNVSVGYSIDAIKLEETRDDGTDVYLVSKWTPYEVSIVTIPADLSAGVGRSVTNPPHQTKSNDMNRDALISALKKRGITVKGDETDEQLLEMVSSGGGTPTPATAQRTQVQITADNTAAATAERSRISEIQKVGERFKVPELANAAVNDGRSLQDFNRDVLEELTKRKQHYVDSHSPIGLTNKEARGFRFVNLFRHLATPTDSNLREAAKFEIEACEAAAKIKKTSRGTSIPMDVLAEPLFLLPGEYGINRSMRTAGTISVNTGSGLTGTGGNTVQTQLMTSGYFDILRNLTTVLQRGTPLTGLNGNIQIPKQLTNIAYASWIGENEPADLKDMTFGQIGLAPHTIAAYAAVTRQMLHQSSLDVEAIVRQDLAKAMGQGIDLAGYYGNGGNSPTGIRYTSGINTVYFAGDNPVYGEIIDMETAVTEANISPDNCTYIHRARMRGYFKKTKRFDSDSTSVVLWESNGGNGKGGINGYESTVTNQIRTGHLFFSDMSELLIGLWGGLDVVLDPFTDSNKGQIRITNFMDADFAIRRPQAFTFGVRLSGSGS